jgi:uncharacterized membrane protein YGL010W
MVSIQQNLTQYAAYHRDRRNIATHFVGVPMIVFAIILALATVWIPLGPVTATLAVVFSALTVAYYLALDVKLAITMAIVYFLMCAAASEITHRLGPGASLGLAGAIFVVGWIIQFVGHKFEGMKPAFFDDAKQLLIGPVFVCAEAYFLLGLREDLRGYIEARVGPTVARRDGRPIPLGTYPDYPAQ